jgi:catechol 2,3-dioxygenase-like lactoylglutathione lyase family enzyme
MIGYATLGSNDLKRSAAFFDSILSDLGGTRCRTEPNLLGWRFSTGGAELYVLTPYDGECAQQGNGQMLGLYATTTAIVHSVYEKAIALGALDEGQPGPRSYSPGFYAGYFRDPDGNKLNVFCFAEQDQLLPAIKPSEA